MKIVCCAYGKVGLGNLIELLTYPTVDSRDLLVFTYNIKSNQQLIEFLDNMDIKYSFDRINNCYQQVKEFAPKYIISMFYRNIISPEILEICGIENTLNVHQSLLPKYRGRFITFWLIYNGEKYAGITYHHMEPDVDSGKIILQDQFLINPHDTAYSLYHKLTNLCICNFKKAFDRLLLGFKAIEQEKIDLSKENNDGKILTYLCNDLPFSGKIYVDNIDEQLEQIDRFIRAMYFPPKSPAQIELKNGKIICIDKPPTIDKLKEFISCNM